MKLHTFKTVVINNFDIAYREHGEGEVYLLVHGFAGSSLVWETFVEQMPENSRCIAIDLKGFGESFKAVDEQLSLFNQAEIISGFVAFLQLNDFNLVAHSSGAVSSLIAMFDPHFEAKVKKLFVIASDAYLGTLPEFINQARQLISDHLFYPKVIDRTLVKSLLTQAFYDPAKIDNDTIDSYLISLKKHNAKKSILASARQIEIGNHNFFIHKLGKITTPVTILIGDHDRVLDPSSLKLFHSSLQNSEIMYIPDCGHLPQLEQPKYLAELILNHHSCVVQDATSQPVIKSRKGSLRRLIDGFDPTVFFLVMFMKILQITHKLFFRVESKGWRHLSGIFLRSDHSKFVLTAFRLNYTIEKESIHDLAQASKEMATKWMNFQRQSSSLHWCVHYKGMYTFSRKTTFNDVVQAVYDEKGHLVSLTPYFDNQCELPVLDLFLQKKVLEIIIKANNETSHLADPKRYKRMINKINWQQHKVYKLSLATRTELKIYSKRVLEATFINFSKLSSYINGGEERLSSPPFAQLRHPGVGLTNIHCRFTEDLKEADVWCQFHHVPVDGTIMQEELDRLKVEWGTAGEIEYPSTYKPEITSFNTGRKELYQGRVFFDFEQINRVRKELNRDHLAEMGGPATIASLLTWGITQHKCFRKHKIAFPVDLMNLGDSDGSETTLMFIRPSVYFNKRNLRESFYAYQTEFNQRLYATRTREGENYQVLELFAVTNKFIQFISKSIFKHALGRAVGSVGLSIVKNAEVILPPASDLQSNGFITIGNFRLPTDIPSKRVGCLSIRGTKKQVDDYFKAFNAVFTDFEKHLPEL